MFFSVPEPGDVARRGEKFASSELVRWGEGDVGGEPWGVWVGDGARGDGRNEGAMCSSMGEI